MTPPRRVQRPAKCEPFDALKEFIGECAKIRKQLNPATLQQNLREFGDEMDQDSKDLLADLVRAFRRPQ